MERSHECESVILVPPLQFNEGFFVLTHAATFTPRSNQFESVQDGCFIDIHLMSTRNYVFEDCRIISIVTRSTVLFKTML